MKPLHFLCILMICFSSHGYAQGGFFWTQYASENPAATGVNSNLDISSITNYRGNGIIGERINADIRVKKLHGALGVGYRYLGNGPYYQLSNSYLNYSFHWKTGENSLLAFGANVDLSSQKYSADYSAAHANYARYGIGVHYQWKGLKVGLAASAFEVVTYYGTKKLHYELSDAYIDYTLKLGENWALNAAVHSGSYSGSSMILRAIYKNKFWFGVQGGEGFGEGLMLGLNLNDKWSIGYSISAEDSYYEGFRVTNQSLSLRFQLPGK